MTPVVRRIQQAVPPLVRGPLVGLVIAAGAAVGVKVVLDPPIGSVVNGLCTGALYGLIGVALILIYRTNRIINFAVAALGAVPGILAVLLMVVKDWPWAICFPLAILGGALTGGLVEVLVIRRFTKAPRLILTVATIGLSQILAFIGFLQGLWLGTKGNPQPAPITPFTKTTTKIGGLTFSMDYGFAVIAVLLAVGGLAAFLRYTRMGIAMRASAENADRAALLGIPVARVQTVAWVIAGTLAGLVIFLRSTIVGVPANGALGPQILLFALAAAVIARMESIPICLAAGIGIGAVAESSLVATGSDSVTAGIMLAVILVALLAQRGKLSRAQDTGVGTWQATKELRAIPRELRDVKEVRIAKGVVAAFVGLFFLVFPLLVGESRLGFAQSVVITCIVAVSIVMLTGWAGQITLGQFGIVGIGAAVGGRLVVSLNMDFFAVLILGALTGAVVAVLIGLPALRLPGPYLAVTTLAFSAATQFLFLNRTYRFGGALLPDDGKRILTPCLWERVCLGNGIFPTYGYYYLCLVILGGVVLMARAYRRNRAGRAVVAVRDNVRAAASLTVEPARTKLGAFAVSGAIAALAGVLFAYQSGSVDAGSYSVDASIRMFVTVVIGGLTSIGGAIFGTVVLESIRLFGESAVENLSLLVTGPGLLLVLLLLPGGFAEGLYRLRDMGLRWIADRNGILVPSLVADRRVAPADEERDIVEAAEHHVEEQDAFDVLTGGPAVRCPVCGERIPAEAAPDHDHLRAEPELAVR